MQWLQKKRRKNRFELYPIEYRNDEKKNNLMQPNLFKALKRQKKNPLTNRNIDFQIKY